MLARCLFVRTFDRLSIAVVLACVSPAHAEIPCSAVNGTFELVLEAREAAARAPEHPDRGAYEFAQAYAAALQSDYNELVARCRAQQKEKARAAQEERARAVCVDTPTETLCGILPDTKGGAALIEGLRREYRGRVRVR